METEIADKLKQTVPKPEPQKPLVNPPPPTDYEIADTTTLPMENMLLQQQMFDFLDIPIAGRKNNETIQAVNSVLEWAHEQSGSRDFGDLLKVINRQEGVMGSRLLPDRLWKLYKYVKINRQMSSLYEQERALYGR